MLVAVEILNARRGRPSAALRRPWLVAFGFGLLHGFGFAGALAEVGLPDDAPTQQAKAAPKFILSSASASAGNLTPRALAAASASLVRREMSARSFSASAA